jgi:3-methyl-2-oxobutanoate hydroxymethyltransferase
MVTTVKLLFGGFMKKTIMTLKNMKLKSEKITMITAYDYSMASLFDSCGVDSILVGDSLGMVCLGYENTLSVTIEEMIHHTKAVSRGTKNALVVSDMPFMSYHVSVEEAVKNAGRLIKEGGAEAIKLEGVDFEKEIKAIIRAQIPVMGHIGLTPQSINVFGGYKVQGKDVKVARKMIDDAKSLEDAGVFALVLECIPGELAQCITNAISIPTIGIGAGLQCDGQVLVYHDMLNFNCEDKKKFVKIFNDVGTAIKNGVESYVNEVKRGVFPDDSNTFNSEELITKLYS